VAAASCGRACRGRRGRLAPGPSAVCDARRARRSPPLPQAARAAGFRAPGAEGKAAAAPAAAGAAEGDGGAGAAAAAAAGGGGVASVIGARLIGAKCVQDELAAAAVDFKKKFAAEEQPAPKAGPGGSGSESGGSDGSGDGGAPGSEEESTGAAEGDEGASSDGGEAQQETEEEEMELDQVALGALGKLLQRHKRCGAAAAVAVWGQGGVMRA
jgi:hypothetical protein